MRSRTRSVTGSAATLRIRASASCSSSPTAHYDALFDHAEFTQEYWARCDALLGGAFKPDTLHAILDGFEVQLAEAELRNRARWPEMAPRNGKFEDELNALKSWLDARLSWITQQKGITP